MVVRCSRTSSSMCPTVLRLTPWMSSKTCRSPIFGVVPLWILGFSDFWAPEGPHPLNGSSPSAWQSPRASRRAPMLSHGRRLQFCI
ncbi:hypothetical protein BD626DRAFT_636030 [Schizophyllum amplum]|uniref:Uncharacterized protein n=1 Tax=Schizophyllum amplum TaxID=97359 RepID=A0A550BUD3_9AGAR|nr:hypothetical protein BD626DRAFT_636030 [Auriculariopsis ampla]